MQQILDTNSKIPASSEVLEMQQGVLLYWNLLGSRSALVSQAPPCQHQVGSSFSFSRETTT